MPITAAPDEAHGTGKKRVFCASPQTSGQVKAQAIVGRSGAVLALRWRWPWQVRASRLMVASEGGYRQPALDTPVLLDDGDGQQQREHHASATAPVHNTVRRTSAGEPRNRSRQWRCWAQPGQPVTARAFSGWPDGGRQPPPVPKATNIKRTGGRSKRISQASAFERELSLVRSIPYQQGRHPAPAKQPCRERSSWSTGNKGEYDCSGDLLKLSC